MPENRAGPPASRNHGVFSRIFHWNSPGHGAAAVRPCRTAIPQVKEVCLLLPTMRAGTVWRVAEWVKAMGCGRSLLDAVTAKRVGLSIPEADFSEPLLYRRSIFRRPRGFSGGPLDLRQRSSIPFLMSRNFTSAPAITYQAEQKHNNTLIINNFYWLAHMLLLVFCMEKRADPDSRHFLCRASVPLLDN
jgi:hypothetical protein